MIERYSRLEAVRSELERGYVYEVDDETLVTGAIRGMMASLEDPYTFYYTEEEMEAHRRETGGAYVAWACWCRRTPRARSRSFASTRAGPRKRRACARAIC